MFVDIIRNNVVININMYILLIEDNALFAIDDNC